MCLSANADGARLFASHSGLRRAYGLSTNPYPVHRLDKVRFGTQRAPGRCFKFARASDSVVILFVLGLSQGTTGVLVLARTKALARELSQQFRARAIDKSYLALVVHGDDDDDDHARRFFPAKEGLIDASLSFDDDGRVRLGVQADASLSGAPHALPLAGGSKAARTTWEVLATSVSR
jgi:23S rRNA-/tRNA-specific pseudouridylate synthase